jgi:hypothetical protein
MGIFDLAETPRLARFSYATLYAVIAARLTMREAAPLIDYDDGGLRGAVIRRLPAGAARQDLEGLEAMSTHLRTNHRGAGWRVAAMRFFEEMCGSTLNRLRLLNENPVLRLALGTEKSLTWGDQIQPGKVTIIDAELGDVLDAEDQRHLVMAMLADIWRTCRSRPPSNGVRTIISIDEVGSFPTPVLAEINDQGAEFRLSVIGSHQFLSQFTDPKTQDRRLLDSFLTDTGAKICFGKLPWGDAEQLAELFEKHHLDPDRKQFVQDSPRQLQRVVNARSHTAGTSEATTHSEGVAYTHAEAASRGVTESRAVGKSTSEGMSSMSGVGIASGSFLGQATTDGVTYGGVAGVDAMSTHSSTLNEALSNAETAFEGEGFSEVETRSEVEGVGVSESISQMDASTISGAAASSHGATRSVTDGPMVVPTEVFQEPTYQIESLDSQLHRRIAAMIKQPERHALLVVGKEPPIPFRVGDVPDPVITEHQALALDLDMMNDHRFFSTTEEIEAEIASRHRQLLEGRSTTEVVDEALTRDELGRRLAQAVLTTPRLQTKGGET